VKRHASRTDVPRPRSARGRSSNGSAAAPLSALATAYRRESELARRFAAIADGETVSPDEVDAAIDARQFAEARLGEWST
jgi:hypothetical protein